MEGYRRVRQRKREEESIVLSCATVHEYGAGNDDLYSSCQKWKQDTSSRSSRSPDQILCTRFEQLFKMIPVSLAEMQLLKESDPDIYQEFKRGNWVVNKNPHVLFCSLGADNALELVNRSMKVSGGLIGITLNTNARSKYFLIAPELARLAEKAKEMSGMSAGKRAKQHHDLSTTVRMRQKRTSSSWLPVSATSQIPSSMRAVTSSILQPKL